MANENQAPPSQEELLQRALLGHKGNESLRQNQAQERTQAQVQTHLMEPVEAAANSFAQSFTLGASDYAKAAGGYLGETLANQPEVQPSFQRNLEEARAEGRGLAERNPVTSGVAGLAGSVLSPASKVAKGAGFLTKVAQPALGAGVQGFLESGSEDLAGKLADAATSASMSAVANTGLAAGGKVLKALGSKAGAEKAAEAALSPSVAVANEIKGLNTKLAGKGGESVGRMLLGDKLVRAGDTIYQTAERVKEARKASGDLIGSFLTELDEKAAKAGFKMQNPVQILRDSLAPVDKMLRDQPNAQQVLSTIKPRIEAFVDSYATSKSPTMQLANLHRFQSELRHAFDGADSVTKEALKKLESGLSGKLEKEVERISKAAGASALATYQGLKTRFNMLRLAEDAVEQGAAKAEAAQSNVFTKTLWRLPAVTSMLMGNPAAAPAAFAPEVIQLARTRAGNVMAASRNVMSDLAQKIPVSLEAAERVGRGGILEALKSLTGK